jgi:hypothetical protein
VISRDVSYMGVIVGRSGFIVCEQSLWRIPALCRRILLGNTVADSVVGDDRLAVEDFRKVDFANSG